MDYTQHVKTIKQQTGNQALKRDDFTKEHSDCQLIKAHT